MIICEDAFTFIFARCAETPAGQVLIVESPRSHLGTQHSVALLWMSDQSDTETPTLQHTTLTRDRHP